MANNKPRAHGEPEHGTVMLLVVSAACIAAFLAIVIWLTKSQPIEERHDVAGAGSIDLNTKLMLLKGAFSRLASLPIPLLHRKTPYDGGSFNLLIDEYINVGVSSEILEGLEQIRAEHRRTVKCLQQAQPEAENKAMLPLLYMEVASFRLLIRQMTHNSFPFPLLGAVHKCTRLWQHRPLQAEACSAVRLVLCSIRVSCAYSFASVYSHGRHTWLSCSPSRHGGRFRRPDAPVRRCSHCLGVRHHRIVFSSAQRDNKDSSQGLCGRASIGACNSRSERIEPVQPCSSRTHVRVDCHRH